MPWDPDKYNPDDAPGDGEERDRREVPSGPYVVGIVFWKRITDRAVKLGLEVLAGPMKGAAAWPMISTNVDEKRGSANRMFHFCKSFHIKGPLEFDDDCFSQQFRGRAGKVRLEKRKNGQYTNYDIKKAFHRAEASEREREIMVAWEEAFQSRRGDSSGGSDSGWDDEAPMPGDEFDTGDSFTDDDIPF